MTIDQITCSVRQDEVPDALSFLAGRMEQCFRLGQINSYFRNRSTLRAVRRFSGDAILPVFSITPEWLRCCEAKWRRDGLSDTTINIYMRTLKCAFSDLLRSCHFPPESSPFGPDRYVIPPPRVRKIALTRPQVAALAAWNGPLHLLRERDLWMFSYLCNGINFRDMLFLRHSNIVEGEIEFVRSKTRRSGAGKRVIRAPVTPRMGKIIDRFANDPERCGDFIFPYAREGMSPEEIAMLVRREIARCNRALRRITRELGLPDVTTYTARHSFATVLKREGVDITYISECLGHSNIVVTQTYLAGFERAERARFASLLTEE